MGMTVPSLGIRFLPSDKNPCSSAVLSKQALNRIAREVRSRGLHNVKYLENSPEASHLTRVIEAVGANPTRDIFYFLERASCLVTSTHQEGVRRRTPSRVGIPTLSISFSKS